MAFLTILFFLPIFLFFLIQRRKTHKNIRLPPGPRGLPIIGNLHQFDGSKPQNVWKLSQKYGPLMSLRLGFLPVLIVSSAKMAKEVMKTHDLEFCSRPALLTFKKLSYNCSDLAFSPYNDYWREMRKICVVHLFNSNRVKNFRPIREDEVSRMIEKISKLGFGKRYEDEGTERSRFHALLNEAQALVASICFSDCFPFMGWLDKLTGMIGRLENNFKEFDRFYQELIEEHLDPKEPKNDQEDIIDVLLQIRKERGFKIDVNWDQMKAVLTDVFIAGTDTSAATVVWAMTLLMKNPRAMEKGQEEIRSSIGNKGFVDEDDIQELPYLKAIVKETLRLQPVAPFLIPRETMENSIIEGYEIPPKTLVFVNAWAIGRDPEAWGNPDEFDPERFIGSSVDFKGQHFEFIPFGAGRRICPGLYMGLATVELALANLLYKFDWEMPSGMKKEDLDFDALQGLTRHKKNALCLMARHINNRANSAL
ncbi:cytochrome P450 83B1-like [Pistacia vera]|uniref:cytochrome P450 83B1-like n=1 Tax=Pistacia vera TaxID=55513 RepID=UPI0012635A1C|nr:cytochrome P450 83B1-like [Pistacia vera]